MIDTFALVLTHGLLLLAAWKLLRRADLDSETPAPKTLPHKTLPPKTPESHPRA